MVTAGSGAVSGAIAKDERVVVYALLVRWAAPRTAVDGCRTPEKGSRAGRANLGVAPAASGPGLARSD